MEFLKTPPKNSNSLTCLIKVLKDARENVDDYKYENKTLTKKDMVDIMKDLIIDLLKATENWEYNILDEPHYGKYLGCKSRYKIGDIRMRRNQLLHNSLIYNIINARLGSGRGNLIRKGKRDFGKELNEKYNIRDAPMTITDFKNLVRRLG